MKQFIKYPLFLFCQFSASAFQIASIEEVYEEAYDAGSIIGYQDEKVYLNSGSLIWDEGDWLLDLSDDCYALLPKVYLDNLGHYIRYYEGEELPVTKCGTKERIQILPKCPRCKQDYFINCKTSECVAERKRLENEHKERQKKKSADYKEKKDKQSKEEKQIRKAKKEKANKDKLEHKKNKKSKKT